MNTHDDFDQSLNAALASLPQLRPSAAFSAGVLAAWSRRPAAAPVWPLAAALTLSSLALAAGAMRLTISIPVIASYAAQFIAVLQLAGRLAFHEWVQWLLDEQLRADELLQTLLHARDVPALRLPVIEVQLTGNLEGGQTAP